MVKDFIVESWTADTMSLRSATSSNKDTFTSA